MNCIPLVKRGDVNEINTALIAIKKQLQELTQLVNSLNDIEVESTDMSEYIKKSSLTDSVESGNGNPVTSGGVYTAIGNEANARNTAITNAINELDVSATGGDTSYISAISETNGKISATAKSVVQTYSSTGTTAISGAGVADAIGTLDVTDTAVSGKYVSAVSETDGKISVTRANLPNTINNTKSLNGSVTCSTAAGTAAKTVSLSGFTLVKGAKFIINLQNANTAQSALTLNVNSTGAKTIVWDGTVTSSTNYAMPTGYYNCYYDGTYWFMESYYEAHNARVASRALSADSSAYATTSLKTTVRTTVTCSTGASTVAKIVSINGYTLSTRDELLIYFSTANTASNPTLNVNSTGAKPIKVFGTSPNSTNKLLKVGTYYCQYDGTNWNCYPYGATNEISADNMQTVTSGAVYNALQSTFQGELNGEKSATSSTFKAMEITTCGKVKTFKIRVINLSNSNVGTTNAVYVGSIALYPKSKTYAIGADVIHSGAVCQARLESSGALYISESMGIPNGNNYIEIPFTIITD